MDNLNGIFAGKIKESDRFGGASAVASDIDGDSVPELLIGAFGCDSAGTNKGIIYICYMHGVPQLNTLAPKDLSYIQISVYPNPSSYVINISIPFEQRIQSDIYLFNVAGQHLKTFSAFSISESSNITLNVSDLTEGLYYIEFLFREIVMRKKILIQGSN